MSAGRPAILGLTGSIGMGKSTVAQIFADFGVPVFDADAEIRAMQGPQGSLVEAIEAIFPGSTDDLGVRRDILGAQVFAEPAALARLEALVHPAVYAKREAFLARHSASPLVLIDIPLLFEKGSEQGLDAIIVVSAPAQVQRERVMARDGMTEAKFADILALQMPDEEKRARADFIIDTGTSYEQTRQRVREVLTKLMSALPAPQS